MSVRAVAVDDGAAAAGLLASTVATIEMTGVIPLPAATNASWRRRPASIARPEAARGRHHVEHVAGAQPRRRRRRERARPADACTPTRELAAARRRADRVRAAYLLAVARRARTSGAGPAHERKTSARSSGTAKGTAIDSSVSRSHLRHLAGRKRARAHSVRLEVVERLAAARHAHSALQGVEPKPATARRCRGEPQRGHGARASCDRAARQPIARAAAARCRTRAACGGRPRSSSRSSTPGEQRCSRPRRRRTRASRSARATSSRIASHRRAAGVRRRDRHDDAGVVDGDVAQDAEVLDREHRDLRVRHRARRSGAQRDLGGAVTTSPPGARGAATCISASR